MNKKIFFGILLILILIPTFSFSATIEKGEEYSLSSKETVSDNLYILGGKIIVSGKVLGDLIALGGDVLLNGNIERDVHIVAGNINILSIINGDLRVAGGNILVEEDIKGELVAVGGSIHTLSDSVISNDMVVLGGVVIVDSQVNGKLKIFAGDVSINGRVLGDTVVHSNEKIKIGPNASINGSLTYSAPNEIEISEGASILGNVVRQDAPFFGKRKDIKGFFAGVLGMVIVFKTLAIIIAGLLGVIIFKRFSREYVDIANNSFGKSLILGFVTLVVIPVVTLILLISIFGAFVAVIIGFIYLFIVVIASVYSGIILGSFLQRKILNQDEVNWTTVILGIVILAIISLIPLIGWIITFVFFLVSLGTITNILYEKVWTRR